MKVLSVFKYTFSAIGIAMLIGAAFAYKNSSDFLVDAVSTQGKIVGVVEKRSNDSVNYFPVVTFIGGDDQVVEFTSSSGGSKYSYPVGEMVEVLYSPNNVEHARINGFFDLWGATVVFVIFGSVFLFIGAIIFLIGAFKSRKKEYLQRHGVTVEAKIQSVAINESILMNGRNPFVIVSHWFNSSTMEVHVFESENIWFDPSPYLERETVNVLVEKNNPKKYYVDISFLPTQAR